MIKRFNLYKEGSFSTQSDLTARWLGPSDMKFIETKEYTFWQFIAEMMNGNKCLGLIKDGTVVSYLWVNNNFLVYHGIKKPLKNNESYLYTSVTKPELKGNGYAEILRSKCYDILREQGKDTFYSFTDADNNSALRFKEKIGAEKIKSYLFIKFWKFKYLRDERL